MGMEEIHHCLNVLGLLFPIPEKRSFLDSFSPCAGLEQGEAVLRFLGKDSPESGEKAGEPIPRRNRDRGGRSGKKGLIQQLT